MAAGLRHRFEHVGAQLGDQLVELLALQRAQLRRVVDRLEEFVARRVASVGGQVVGNGRHR
ncbi:hypothetical protein D3C83_227220 [compost metagenome]